MLREDLLEYSARLRARRELYLAVLLERLVHRTGSPSHFFGVKNATFLSSVLRYIREGDTVYDRDTLLLPNTTVRSYDEYLPTLMRPAFNALWQALGFSKSLCCDKEGNWNAKDFRG